MKDVLRNHRQGGLVHRVVTLYTTACGWRLLARALEDGPTDDDVSCFYCVIERRRDEAKE